MNYPLIRSGKGMGLPGGYQLLGACDSNGNPSSGGTFVMNPDGSLRWTGDDHSNVQYPDGTIHCLTKDDFTNLSLIDFNPTNVIVIANPILYPNQFPNGVVSSGPPIDQMTTANGNSTRITTTPVVQNLPANYIPASNPNAVVTGGSPSASGMDFATYVATMKKNGMDVVTSLDGTMTLVPSNAIPSSTNTNYTNVQTSSNSNANANPVPTTGNDMQSLIDSYMPSFLTESSLISGVPNYMLVIGGIVGLMMFKGKG